jgi:3-oxoacyl-[acyl-carrier-protein] synthase III
MASERHAIIRGTGAYVPEKRLTNHDLEKLVDTSDEWIRSRVGIVERRIADDSVASSDLGAKAAERALEAAGVDREEVDLVLCSTVSPDMIFPSTACLISRALGIEHRVPAMDLAAACAGFSYALHMANGLIKSGMHKTILVTAAEMLTRHVDWTDRATCVLFGDGAGAAVVQAGDPSEGGILHTSIGAESIYADPQLLGIPAGGTRMPPTAETVANGDHYIKMEGRKLFKIAMSMMPEVVKDTLAEAGMTMDDIKLLVPHQMNMRIVANFADRLDIEMERIYVNVDRYGNTSSASVIIALNEAIERGRVGPGDKVFLITFGAGWTWGANIIQL